MVTALMASPACSTFITVSERKYLLDLGKKTCAIANEVVVSLVATTSTLALMSMKRPWHTS